MWKGLVSARQLYTRKRGRKRGRKGANEAFIQTPELEQKSGLLYQRIDYCSKRMDCSFFPLSFAYLGPDGPLSIGSSPPLHTRPYMTKREKRGTRRGEEKIDKNRVFCTYCLIAITITKVCSATKYKLTTTLPRTPPTRTETHAEPPSRGWDT